jgi:DNA-binding transcriptional LysR family regulator
VIGQGFDGGVRLTEAVPPDMIAVPITSLARLVVVGAPSYFTMHAAPRVPGDLRHHQCIRARLASGRIYHWEFERHGENLAIDVPGTLLLDDSGLMLQAALAGVGLSYLSEAAVAEHVTTGRLVQVLDDWTPSFQGLSLYHPSRRHVPAKLRALIGLIGELYLGAD